MAESKVVRHDGGETTVYPENSIKVECPIHGDARLAETWHASIRLTCGCEWRHGGGSLAGWFKEKS
jgi:hypothetical protein